MRVFSNLAISLDGKIADQRDPTHSLGTPLDRQTMDVLRRQADAIVVGSHTLRAHPRTMRVKVKGKKKTRQPVNVVVTASGMLDPDMDYWKDPEVVRFVFTTERGFAAASAAAQERAFVVKAGREKVEIPLLLKRLAESGLKNILVEGGGELVANFLKANCLQELYVTLTPWLLGGRANPTLVGGEGLETWAKIKLLKLKKIKDEIYFHYKVPGALRKYA